MADDLKFQAIDPVGIGKGVAPAQLIPKTTAITSAGNTISPSGLTSGPVAYHALGRLINISDILLPDLKGDFQATGTTNLPSPSFISHRFRPTGEAQAGWDTRLRGGVLVVDLHRFPPAPGFTRDRIGVLTQRIQVGLGKLDRDVEGGAFGTGVQRSLEVISIERAVTLFGQDVVNKVLALELGDKVTRGQLVAHKQTTLAALLFPGQAGAAALEPLALPPTDQGIAKPGGVQAGEGKGVDKPPLPGPIHDC